MVKVMKTEDCGNGCIQHRLVSEHNQPTDVRSTQTTVIGAAETELDALLSALAEKDKQIALNEELSMMRHRRTIAADLLWEKARAALSPDAGKGKRVVDVEDINRLFEVIEARHVSNPEIVVIEMLEFARKYIPEHPNAQANTLREKVLADARLRYRVVDVETLERIGGYLMALRMDRPVYDEHGELLGHWQTAATE